jgi:carbon-monoxide dehydrogenase small subunit
MTVEPEPQAVSLSVNGEPQRVVVEPRRTLADCLREDLGLTGTHLGCEHGVCGACTVLVDGDAVRSCLMLAVQADGCEVTTVEGLAIGAGEHPLQTAFRENFAVQCGFCTPGLLISAVAFLRDEPNPSREDVRRALSGNLCRCTGYHTIVDAVMAAARELRQ